MHEEFVAFCQTYASSGSLAGDTATLRRRTDADVIKQWEEEVVVTGRMRGLSDPLARLEEMDRDGRAADVLFPDFGLPFQIGTPFTSTLGGHTRTQEQIEAGNKAHNRWLADYIQVTPHRFAAMALTSFTDVGETLTEIRWAKDQGFKGILLPAFADDDPLFSERFEPIWNLLEDLDLPLNSHIGTSSISQVRLSVANIPHPASALPLFSAQNVFFCHQILSHFIWSGILERHPKLKLVFTEQGSGWVVGELEAMDFSYEKSYLRRDIRDIIKQRPGQYFARQCYLGSSIFSRAEMEERYRIGVNKMMLGMDYPHHEGAWAMGPGSVEYLRATVGAAHVPAEELRTMLAETAIGVWGLDRQKLAADAERIGPPIDLLLTPPEHDYYPRGDVKKPAGTAM
jgi:predicted TIM-barrel fold metal-dependent hydrolase